jgi:mersacidin/lichenicidin family type 2 lantibiotic
LYHEQKKGNFHVNNIVRAWKDEAYRQSLSAEEQAMLPENPAGGFELTDADLEALCGASGAENKQSDFGQCNSQAFGCKVSTQAESGSIGCNSFNLAGDCEEPSAYDGTGLGLGGVVNALLGSK